MIMAPRLHTSDQSDKGSNFAVGDRMRMRGAIWTLMAIALGINGGRYFQFSCGEKLMWVPERMIGRLEELPELSEAGE